MKSGFQHCSLLQEVGILLARGLFVGLVRLKPARARTSQPTKPDNRRRGLFPLSVVIPPEISSGTGWSFLEPPRFFRTSRAKMDSSLQCLVELLLWSGICSGRSTYRKSA